jgi:hypothetical protein
VSFSNRWRIGRIIPLIIAVAFLVDFTARFIPLDWLSFRAWEALARYHAPCGPFRANALYENPLSYGDLTSLGNLPRYRQYRQEIFSTDSFGFRRNSHLKPAPAKYDILVVGDSFMVGTGVNDDETLSAKLEQHLGVGVYNGAAGFEAYATLNDILSLARRLNIAKGTVLYEYYQQHNLPHREYLTGDTYSKNEDSCLDWQTRFSIGYEGFVEVSPLQILGQRIFKKLHNDSILPNPYRSGVVVKTLENGEPILFYPKDVATSRVKRRGVDVSGFKALDAELKKHNLRLVLLLVPTKYTIYRSLLKDDDIKESAPGSYLDVVEKSLREADIPVVNLLSSFKQKAAEDYKSNMYIYWRDDTHWNARGVELAAQEILKQKLLP